MSRVALRSGFAAAVTLGLRLLVPAPAGGQEAGPPVPGHVAVRAPEVPIRMLADEGRPR